MFAKFWKWYEKNETLNIGVAASLFSLQLIHLYWLTAHVVALKLFGQSFFNLKGIGEIFILIVDYTEIPALITTSLVYINDLRKGKNLKAFMFLVFLNSQWLHIFWITDEYVLEQFTQSTFANIPIWLSWVAILIDYLELPVIFDTLKKFAKTLRESGVKPAFSKLKEN